MTRSVAGGEPAIYLLFPSGQTEYFGISVDVTVGDVWRWLLQVLPPQQPSCVIVTLMSPQHSPALVNKN